MTLRKCATLNLAGAIIPLLIAVPSLALLARVLGTERFALVTLAWALVGYASVFDLGLSRSVVRLISSQRARPAEQAHILATGLVVVIGLSVLACLALLAARDPLLRSALKVSNEAMPDADRGFAIVALTLPLLLPTVIVQGFWDGQEDFMEANLQRVVGGSLVPLLTAAAAAIEPTFTAAMIGLLLARVAALTMALGRRRLWLQVVTGRPTRVRLFEMLHFGGWVTVSNAVGPIMGYLDRYMLAYTNSAAVVAYYAAPSEAALKLLVLPAAVTRGLFPKLASAGGDARELLRQSHHLVAATCIPLAVVIALFAPWILSTWLGSEYGEHSSLVLQVLMLGYLFCAFAQIPFTELQAAGRADITAKIHLLEVLPFLALAFALTTRYGIVGAAAAWTVRNAVDYALLTGIARRLRS